MKDLGDRLKKDVRASRLVFRVRDIRASPTPPPGSPTLPHKQGGAASPRMAFQPGARFTLEVFSRFGPLAPNLEKRAEDALEVWLLLGALGLRANRGGGSVWPANGQAPKNERELRERLNRCGCQWPVMLAGEAVGSTPQELRAAATDTMNGEPHLFGSAKPRKASAIKFKVIRLGEQYRLLATAPTTEILERARKALQGKRSRPETWEYI